MTGHVVPQAYGPLVISGSEVGAEYTVVLRGRSAARFLPEEVWELALNVPNLDLEAIRVRAFTRWVDEANKQLPRELVIEVRGRTGSLDEQPASSARSLAPSPRSRAS